MNLTFCIFFFSFVRISIFLTQVSVKFASTTVLVNGQKEEQLKTVLISQESLRGTVPADLQSLRSTAA